MPARMYTVLTSILRRSTTVTTLLVICSFLIFAPAVPVIATVPTEISSGYVMFYADHYGPFIPGEPGACASVDEVQFQLKLMELDSTVEITDWTDLQVRYVSLNRDTDLYEYSPWYTSGPLPPFCIHHDDYLAFEVQAGEGSIYRSTYTMAFSYNNDPARDTLRSHRYESNIHLKRKGDVPNDTVEAVSPLNTVHTTVPDFAVLLNEMPTMVPDLSTTNMLLWTWPIYPTAEPDTHSTSTISGGVGTYTQSRDSFEDGWYRWTASLTFDHARALNGFIHNEQPVTGLIKPYGLFIIDRTPPVSTPSHNLEGDDGAALEYSFRNDVADEHFFLATSTFLIEDLDNGGAFESDYSFPLDIEAFSGYTWGWSHQYLFLDYDTSYRYRFETIDAAGNTSLTPWVNFTTPPALSATIGVRTLGSSGTLTTTSPYVLSPSEEIEVEWSSTAADTCIVVSGAGFTTSGNTAGVDDDVFEPAIGASETFSVECSSFGNTVTATITVVQPAAGVAAPAGNIGLSQLAVRPGGTVEVSWDTVNADSCVLEQQNAAGTGVVIGTGVEGSGVPSNPIDAATVISLQCANSGYPDLTEVDSTMVRVVPDLIEI